MKCKNCGKTFKPRKGLGGKQIDCSEACLADRFSKCSKKTRGLGRYFAKTMGYRSMGEVRFAALLKQHKIPMKYEVSVLKYQHKPQKYTPDFTCKKILLEYKGVFDADARKKMVAVKKCNPGTDIRMVFEKPNNKLYKGAKMRYWEWAEAKGFKWYKASDIDKIEEDLK